MTDKLLVLAPRLLFAAGAGALTAGIVRHAGGEDTAASSRRGGPAGGPPGPAPPGGPGDLPQRRRGTRRRADPAPVRPGPPPPHRVGIARAPSMGRLLGVPAAVAVGGAAGRIPDGAWIEPDGRAGTVRILDERPVR
ncbi:MULTISPECIES: hypothetical protein [unclassified Spirillospora]|uniref:hypothetical protein n=1 Tax=unclassified Spirillospora TaxID=2642701 RepID=UPI00372062E2